MASDNLTCETCRFWCPVPPDAHNLGQGPQGECREQLHLITIPAPNGRGFGTLGLYPRLAATWTACGRHQHRTEDGK